MEENRSFGEREMRALEGTSFGSSGVGLTTLKILSYNVWFREDLEVHKRMKALGDLIQQHCPDLICFQEVTPNIYDIFRQSGWWKMYQSSVSNQMADSRPYFCMQLSKLRVKSFSCKPFGYSAMGRELCVAEVEVPGTNIWLLPLAISKVLAPALQTGIRCTVKNV
ncbi:endonuclease/exonuclease/phosphatase family protein [Prunus dulcis]|uniref:Endonuclease/exonuclease/phosphatase family protein n=1 Tax=Prunus dulcis TaxID=3755 RepID=A0A4Y1R9M7_PRUDU|nr:endonuclease/exonuclease/phosphatase family protein [Prunus dulcis]